MIPFLLRRPIAVLMSFLGLLIFSLIAFRQLPISLLPSIDVPQIVIKVNAPNVSPAELERNILAPIRESMVTLNGLKDIESQAESEMGLVHLTFEYGQSMKLAYIEANEKIDRLASVLPKEIERPLVVRVNTSDIPVVRIQVVPKSRVDLVQLSELSEKVLKKRLEQLDGISLVDINGKKEKVIVVEPNKEALQAFGLSENQIAIAIQSNNQELGALSVKDGQYRYYLKLASKLRNKEQIGQIPVRLASGEVLLVRQLATVEEGVKKIQGYHLFQQKEGLVLTVHKQANAQMTKLLSKIEDVVGQFQQDYPDVAFSVTQDQSQLLTASMDNLSNSLLFGGLFAFSLLFLFMGDYRLPLIMGISLPVSLLLSFLFFYLMNLSVNIISLSGLALGLGMLIDNAIVVLDNISKKRTEGLPLFDSCVQGVQEVMGALISSVLTTLAVFIPLIFLDGLSGALFYDQAMAVGIILSVSLLVSFILVPLIYFLFFKNSNKELKEDSRVFQWFLKPYKTLFYFAFRYKLACILLLISTIPLSVLLLMQLDKEGMPPVAKMESVLMIQWNEPVDAIENRSRIDQLLRDFKDDYVLSESDIGISQLMLAQEEHSLERALIYFLFDNQKQKRESEEALKAWLAQLYPRASYTLQDAPNAFDQLFTSNRPYFEARWKQFEKMEPPKEEEIQDILTSLLSSSKKSTQRVLPGPGMGLTDAIELMIDHEALMLHKISFNVLQEKLRQQFGEYTITELKSFGEVTPILFGNQKEVLFKQLQSSVIFNEEGIPYPLNRFVSYQLGRDHKQIRADRSGLYKSLIWADVNQVEALIQKLKTIALEKGLKVEFKGQYFDDLEQLHQLFVILLISVLLLYFILVAQFESFIQPLIVILTLPLGIGGGLFLLWITGSSLNIMSAIGMIVMLGIMVNDAILKMDTMNRLFMQKISPSPFIKGAIHKKEILREAIFEAGSLRLKPIIMTSLTTILALTPVIFSSGIGADLQRPLVIAVIGGLTIGTFTALFFVPLAWWYVKVLSK